MPGPLAIFGGTFDPPHVAHVVAAVQARAQLGLDVVTVVPAGDPWQKSEGQSVSPAALRLAMTRAAFRGVEGIVVSDVEVERSGPTFAIDTIDQLTQPDSREPGRPTLILGADAAAGLPGWHRADELADRVRIAWFPRPGEGEPGLGSNWSVTGIDMPLLEISATQIRSWVAQGRPVDGLVPAGVRWVIEAEGLYRVA